MIENEEGYDSSPQTPPRHATLSSKKTRQQTTINKTLAMDTWIQPPTFASPLRETQPTNLNPTIKSPPGKKFQTSFFLNKT
jgi:hypothetical protein